MTTYGLLGYPLGHSFSRKFFTEKFAREGIDAEYINFELPSIEGYRDMLTSCPTLRGHNVTIPYKQQVIPYLDELSPEARAIGAVNVVKVDPDGRLTGYNSDVIGFVESLRPLLRPHHVRALVLGTGGASRAIVYGLRHKLDFTDILLVSRKTSASPLGEGLVYATYSDITPDIINQYPVIINCTPCGMYPHTDESPNLPYEAMTARNLLYDLVYNPETTQFMQRGAARGATVKNGLEMLLLQAKASWDFWTAH